MKKVIATFFSVLVMGIFVDAFVFVGPSPETLPILSGLFNLKNKGYNPEVVITVETVLKKRKKMEHLILIDVRNTSEFKKFRISGSMNIPIFAIKTKTFLKAKQVILFNEGYRHSQLEKECVRLRDIGFSNVSIMFGGLQCWRKKGGPIEGDIFSQKELNKVTARDFFEERHFDNQVVVNIFEKMNEEATFLIPQTITIPYQNQGKDFIPKLKNVLNQKEGSPLRLVLIYNRNGEYPEGLETLLMKAGIENVYFLKLGLQGYKGFLQQQAQTLLNEKKIVKKCASCL